MQLRLKGFAMETTEKKTKVPNAIKEAVRYVVKTKDGWGVSMTGLEADDGSDADHAGVIGLPMINFKIDGSLVNKARVRTNRGKWLPYGKGLDVELGKDSAITGLEIVGKGLIFAVHVKGGGWLSPAITSDVEGEVAVISGAAFDAIWIDEV